LSLGGLWLNSSAAWAQCDAQQRVIQLNRDAMAAYDNLDVEGALRLLRQAVDRQGGCVSSPVRARTYMNLGVVQVGGFMNNAGGIDAFRRAVCLESAVQLDPLTSNEDVQTAFRLARAQFERQGCPDDLPRPEPEAAARVEETTAPTPQAGFELYRHQVVEEQRRRFPIPYYIEINPAVQVGQVQLLYRVAGESNFTVLTMNEMGSNAFAVTVPCETIALFDPAWVEYYIEIVGPDGDRIGMAPQEGERQPHRTNMVEAYEGPQLSVPGQAPPEECVNCTDLPPGSPIPDACRGRGPGGCDANQQCLNDSDCAGSGQECSDGCCVRETRGRGGRRGSYRPYFYIQAGVGWGGGYVRKTSAQSGTEVPEGALYENLSATAAQDACGNMGDASRGGLLPDDAKWGVTGCWYSVDSPGFGFGAGHLRAYMGGYILPELSVGALLRYQFSGFTSDAPHALWAVGMRVRYHILQLDNMELSVGLHGIFFGSQQAFLAVPQTEGQEKRKGRAWAHGGWQSVGLNVGYAFYFLRRIGFFVEVTSDWTVPDFIWNVELTAGPAFRY
jgi:hypothetical protein